MAFDHDDDIRLFFELLGNLIAPALAEIRELGRVKTKSDIRQNNFFDFNDLRDFLDNFFDHGFLDDDLFDHLFHNHLLRDGFLRNGLPGYRLLDGDPFWNTVVMGCLGLGKERRVGPVAEEIA